MNATVGATWKSRALVTYYYGEPGIYDANSAFNPFVKLSYAIPLTAHWGVNAFAHVEWLGSSIAHSPIVVDSRVTTVFAGVNVFVLIRAIDLGFSASCCALTLGFGCVLTAPARAHKRKRQTACS